MSVETKEFLRGMLSNAIGTLVAAGILGILAFFTGNVSLLVDYWLELSIVLLLLFILVTGTVWFRKLLRLEKQLVDIKNQPKMSIDYSPEIKKVETEIKAGLTKKADRNAVPSIAEFKELRRTVKELEIYKYGQKGQRGELICLIELLKEDIDDNHWGVESVLVDLEKKIDGVKLEGDQITDIEEQLCRLGDKPKYNFLVSKIRKHYQD